MIEVVALQMDCFMVGAFGGAIGALGIGITFWGHFRYMYKDYMKAKTDFKVMNKVISHEMLMTNLSKEIREIRHDITELMQEDR